MNEPKRRVSVSHPATLSFFPPTRKRDVKSPVCRTKKEKLNDNDTALITISTRVSLKRHHTYNLVLDVDDNGGGGVDWTFERIGTEAEKLEVDRELAHLRERLGQVKAWKARRAEIEDELNKVWIEGGEELLGSDST